MIRLNARCIWQTRRWYVVNILACFCLIGIVSSGYGQTDNVSQLINKLNDPDIGVRKMAAKSLGETKDPRAVEPLINALKDTDRNVQDEAFRALGEIKDPRAVEPMIVVLNEMKDRDDFNISELFRLWSQAGILAGFKDPRVDSALLEAVKPPITTWKVIVIRGAYWYFIRRGVPGSEDALIAALNKFGDEFHSDLEMDMATDFLSCGNLKLEQAARELAQRQGWTLTPITGKEALHWGSSR